MGREKQEGGDPGRLRQRSLSSFQYHSSQLFEGLTEKKEYEVNAKGREGEINRYIEPKKKKKKGVRERAINANTNRGNGSKGEKIFTQS